MSAFTRGDAVDATAFLKFALSKIDHERFTFRLDGNTSFDARGARRRCSRSGRATTTSAR